MTWTETVSLALKYVCPSFTHPITISAPCILPWPLEMPNPTHPVAFASTVKIISFFAMLTFQYSLTFWFSSRGEKNEWSAARLAEEDLTANEQRRKTHCVINNIVSYVPCRIWAKNDLNRNSYLVSSILGCLSCIIRVFLSVIKIK